MRITCILSDLGSGGAERVMATLCNSWAAQGHSVTLITLGKQQTDFYCLHSGVNRISLNVLGDSPGKVSALLQNWRRLRALRGAIKRSRPDVILSFVDQTNVLSIVATRGLGIPIIVSERTNPLAHSIGRIWVAMRKISYRCADAIVVQSESLRPWAERFRGAERVRVIANPLSPQFTGLPYRPARARSLTVMAMGRLVPVKGFSSLIAAFARLDSSFGQWHLVIAGEGPERSALQRQVDALNLSQRVQLVGNVKSPEALLLDASVFVLSSHYEGFPNALVEAMACGCAVLSTACPTGPSSLVEHDVSGLLAPINDIAALTSSLARLLSSEDLREALGRRAHMRAANYEAARVIGSWNTLLHDASRSAL